jgi:hypothetical protein
VPTADEWLFKIAPRETRHEPSDKCGEQGHGDTLHIIGLHGSMQKDPTRQVDERHVNIDLPEDVEASAQLPARCRSILNTRDSKNICKMSVASAGTGVAWLRVESRQGIVRRNEL